MSNKGSYYNNARSNEINSKCVEFGCRNISLMMIESLLLGVSYYQRNKVEIVLLCSDGNLKFEGGKRKQYIAVLLMSYSLPYRTKTMKEVNDFINSL